MKSIVSYIPVTITPAYPRLVEAAPDKYAQYKGCILLQLNGTKDNGGCVPAVILTGSRAGEKVDLLPCYYQPFSGSVTLTNET